ncbi:hypothetical protein AX17_004398 [Amanita inopinata Kibby_2008]|nr:hypothetical protein AX17_004398 [Amanita inopinata Kibby_2008]
MSTSSLNKNNSAVKRIMREARELANDPCTDYTACPLENDIFEWHCTLRGPPGTEFEGGLYHFRILLPAEYPFRPPSLLMLTPNGRFELNTKICISFTNYHEELWQPAWGVRTAILGLQGFFPLKGQAAVGVGSIECPASERKRLAILSREWVCPHCQQSNLDLLPDPVHKSEDALATVSETQSLSSVSAISIVAPPTATLSSVNRSESEERKPVLSHELSDANSPSRLANTSNSFDHDEPSSQTTASTSSPNRIEPRPKLDEQIRRIGQQDGVRSSGHKPPLLLDTAICILLVLLFAIICRRMV